MFDALNDNSVSNIYVGTDGKLHKVQGGADSVLNFSSVSKMTLSYQVDIYSGGTLANTKSFSAIYAKNGNNWVKSGAWSGSVTTTIGDQAKVTLKSITLN